MSELSLVRNDPLESTWHRLANHKTLDDVATIHHGVEFKLPREREAAAVITDTPRPGFAPGLLWPGDGFEAYVAPGRIFVKMFPDFILSKSYQCSWSLPKVVVNAGRLSRGPWRIAAVPDNEGLICSHRFHGVWPRKDLSIEVLAAFLNGPIANAFLYSTARGSRDITIERLKAIPIPHLTQSMTDDITRHVTRYRTERLQWEKRQADEDSLQACRSILLQIDSVVLAAYGLPPRAERDVLDVFETYDRPVPVPFTGYYPEGFRPALPLSFFTSQEAEKATAARTLERLPVLRDPVISTALAIVDGTNDPS